MTMDKVVVGMAKDILSLHHPSSNQLAAVVEEVEVGGTEEVGEVATTATKEAEEEASGAKEGTTEGGNSLSIGECN